MGNQFLPERRSKTLNKRMHSFIEYLIEARYAVDHPLVAGIKKSIADGDEGQQRFELNDSASIKEITSTLVRAFGQPTETREQSAGQMGELFWSFDNNDYTMYYLFSDGAEHWGEFFKDKPQNTVYVEKKE